MLALKTPGHAADVNIKNASVNQKLPTIDNQTITQLSFQSFGIGRWKLQKKTTRSEKINTELSALSDWPCRPLVHQRSWEGTETGRSTRWCAFSVLANSLVCDASAAEKQQHYKSLFQHSHKHITQTHCTHSHKHYTNTLHTLSQTQCTSTYSVERFGQVVGAVSAGDGRILSLQKSCLIPQSVRHFLHTIHTSAHTPWNTNKTQICLQSYQYTEKGHLENKESFGLPKGFTDFSFSTYLLIKDWAISLMLILTYYMTSSPSTNQTAANTDKML
jgi:hypothetical protein